MENGEWRIGHKHRAEQSSVLAPSSACGACWHANLQLFMQNHKAGPGARGSILV